MNANALEYVALVSCCCALPSAMRRGFSDIGLSVRFVAVDYGVVALGAIVALLCVARGDFGGAVLCASAAVSSVTDVRRGVILDSVLVVSLAAIVIVSLVAGEIPIAALGGVVGLVAMGSIRAIGRGAMGLGDVKLGGVIGAALGYERGLMALAIAFVLGGLVAAVLLILGRVKRGQTLPFAPYLALGASAVSCNLWPLALPR